MAEEVESDSILENSDLHDSPKEEVNGDLSHLNDDDYLEEINRQATELIEQGASDVAIKNWKRQQYEVRIAVTR